MTKKINIYLILVLISLFITGCGQQETKTTEEKLKQVKVKTLNDSRNITENLEFPATISSGEESQIIAKTNGTVEAAAFKVGNRVRVGEILFKIDDTNRTSSLDKTAFDSSQIKQAQSAAEQARASLDIARNNYNSLLISTEKDLRQAEINKEQAVTGKSNTSDIIAENLKSAQLAYDSAKLAAENAALNLANTKQTLGQNNANAGVNAETTAITTANNCDTIIYSSNELLGLEYEKAVNLAYRNNIGALDSSTLLKGQALYIEAKNLSDEFKNSSLTNINEKLDFVMRLANKTKALADTCKTILEKTITSSNLPANSSTATSLTSLQSTITGYQTQVNIAITQLNAVKQNVNGSSLNQETSLASLEKAYSLARKQEEAAAQNLNNIKAGTNSQKNQAGFSADSAANQYDNVKVRINSQLSVARSQVDIANAQYQNALTSLSALYDSHLGISPISGIVTKKNIEKGATVAAGAVLAVVSKLENVKAQIFIDQENNSLLRLGQKAEIKKDDKVYTARITAIAPQADAASKRFLVEIKPEKNEPDLIAGTVVDIVVPITKKTAAKNTAILPIAAIDVAQNGNFIKIVENGIVKKEAIEIKSIDGETAQIEYKISSDAQLIIEGGKLVEEGEKIEIIK